LKQYSFFRAAEMGLLQDLEVLLPEQLEKSFFADAAHVVPRVLLLVEEDSHVEARLMEDRRRGPADLLSAGIVRAVIADEPQVLDFLLQGILEREAEVLGPSGPLPRRLPEGIAVAVEVGEGVLEPLGHLPLIHEVPPQIDNHPGMLDEDGAAGLARAAHAAAPERVGGDDPVVETRQAVAAASFPPLALTRLGRSPARGRPIAFSPGADSRELRRQRLDDAAGGMRQPGGAGRAGVQALSTRRAGVQLQELPPGEIAQLLGPRGRRRNEPVAQRGIGEEDIQRRGNQVECLREGDASDEGEGSQGVNPPNDAVQRQNRRRGERPEELRKPQAHRRPGRRAHVLRGALLVPRGALVACRNGHPLVEPSFGPVAFLQAQPFDHEPAHGDHQQHDEQVRRLPRVLGADLHLQRFGTKDVPPVRRDR
jgi:hypothetical protein